MKKEYDLTEEEKKMFVRIESPRYIEGERVTRPVVIVYNKDYDIVVGVSSLTQWRAVCKTLPDFKDLYKFELRNLW